MDGGSEHFGILRDQSAERAPAGYSGFSARAVRPAAHRVSASFADFGVHKGKNAIARVLCLYFRAQVLPFCGGSLAEFTKDAPNNFMDVLPSISEGISNSLLEAMASGLPVVATAICGNPEVVADRESGLLVSGGGPRQIGALFPVA
jgi:hypothetical protein